MEKALPDPAVLVTAANSIAIAICRNLTPSEQNVLGNLLTLVAGSMLSIAAISEYNKTAAEANSGADDAGGAA